MESRNITVPDYKDYEYPLQQAYDIACDKLLHIDDIEKQCRLSGSSFRQTGSATSIDVSYLGRPVVITVPEIDITVDDAGEDISSREKILVLHYFITAKGTPPSGQFITFRELPEGIVYLPTFTKRVVKPVMDSFGQEPEKLVKAGELLGGSPADMGDAAVTIPAFSSVSVTYVLWAGDEEFTPQGNVLFDANIPDYLSSEDIITISEVVAWKLVRSVR